MKVKIAVSIEQYDDYRKYSTYFDYSGGRIPLLFLRTNKVRMAYYTDNYKAVIDCGMDYSRSSIDSNTIIYVKRKYIFST